MGGRGLVTRGGVDCDVLLVGAGLANSLIALELDRRRPDLKVLMLEADLGQVEDHTWCVFETDMSAQAWQTLSPSFDSLWPGYQVAFPEHGRDLTTPYGCLTSETLSQILAARANIRIEQGHVLRTTPTQAVLKT
ncbi:MAG: hypothetical protein EON59_11595 [Alphaproteobacteria bacterium]|nr:MAG: hypothetical protein EON59_11595 [Alphaproteobacteria bacterium]